MCWYSHLAGGTEVQVKFMPDRLIIRPLNQMVTLEVLFCCQFFFFGVVLVTVELSLPLGSVSLVLISSFVVISVSLCGVINYDTKASILLFGVSSKDFKELSVNGAPNSEPIFTGVFCFEAGLSRIVSSRN